MTFSEKNAGRRGLFTMACFSENSSEMTEREERRTYFSFFTAISMDGNPSIELTLNRWGPVITAEACNEDGWLRSQGLNGNTKL